MKTGRSLVTGALVVGAIIGVGVTASLNRQSCAPADEVTHPALLPVGRGEGGRAGRFPDFTKLVARVSGSVVNISAIVEKQSYSRRGGQVDPFEFFFGHPGHRRSRSLGSGFILDEEGYILTNHHVVEDADKLIVKLENEKEYEAHVIGSDKKTDIAVIKIDDGLEGLAPVALGDSDALDVGEWVLAIGNPFGLDHTVTAGIVSAKGRHISRPDKSPYDDFIQTDAAINPGNSGGPLINLSGQVVGINSAIYSRSGGNIGIGFAIPINMAREIVPQLRETGHVTRGWLGVVIQPVSDDIARSLDLPEPRGALVASVSTDSPADKGGIKIGDVIVEFDDQEVPKSEDLPAIVAATPVGKDVEVVVIRDGERKTIDITVGKLEDSDAGGIPVKASDLGMAVQDITPEIAKQLGLGKNPKGVVVSSIVRSSPAEEAGIQPGDVIEMIGNKPVIDADDFRKQMAQREKAESVLVLIRRDDQTLFRVIKPPEG